MLINGLSDFWLSIRSHRLFVEKTERSDTTILGILEILAHFRQSPVYPGEQVY